MEEVELIPATDKDSPIYDNIQAKIHWCKTSKNNRPNIWMIVALSGVLATVSLFLSPLAIYAVYEHYHYIPVNFTVQTYNIEAKYCNRMSAWTGYIIGYYPRYTRDLKGNPVPYLDALGDEMYITATLTKICGRYDYDVLERIKTNYPAGKIIKIYQWDQDYTKITLLDPNMELPGLYYSIGLLSIVVFILILNSILVMFCGFDSFTKRCACRFRDPYKD